MRTLNLLLLFTALSCAQPLDERTRVMMGTFASIKLPPGDMHHAEQGFSRLKAVEKALSSYDPEAQIYRLNHERNVSISADTYEALSLAKRYFHESEGYFDVTVGSITRGLFRFGEAQRVPNASELARATVGLNGLHFSRRRAWLDENVTIDLGGMGKGFGVDKAAKALQESGVQHGIIALSGDIRCLDRCTLTVQDPFSETGHIALFTTRRPDTAVSTSGNYRRFVDTKAANHLIDPKRKRSQQAFASITLVSACANSDLDAYATAASVMPRDTALAFLEKIDAGYIVVFSDGTRLSGGELDAYTHSLRWRESAHGDVDEQSQKP